MQASCILKMVTGNRGELGKRLLTRDQRRFQRAIEKKAKNLIRVYEGIANQIIYAIQGGMENTDTDIAVETNVEACTITPGTAAEETTATTTCTLTAADAAPTPAVVGSCAVATGSGPCAYTAISQGTATCFRCAEVGAVNGRRKTHNTYVPSFEIPAALVATAELYIAPIYAASMEVDGTTAGSKLFLIYETVLADMNEQFVEAGTDHGLGYMPAVVKTTTGTMADATNFIKVDADGNNDRGTYAATLAQASITEEMVQPAAITGRRRAQAASIQALIAATMVDEDDGMIAAENEDMNGVYKDSPWVLYWNPQLFPISVLMLLTFVGILFPDATTTPSMQRLWRRPDSAPSQVKSSPVRGSCSLMSARATTSPTSTQSRRRSSRRRRQLS